MTSHVAYMYLAPAVQMYDISHNHLLSFTICGYIAKSCDQLPVSIIAQWVEHRPGITVERSWV